MEKIERRPLPPPNSTATEITEADRSEMLARANGVIDHYLNGPGSYWDAGTRKPLQETIRDLKDFKNRVIASKQLADDPNSVMDTIIKLIDETTEQVEQAERNGEIKDRIETSYPETNDPLDDPRVISPVELNNGALPISDATAPPLVSLGENFDPGQAKADDRFGGRTAPNSAAASHGSSQPGTPLLGLVSGKPMSFHPVQPPIFGFPEQAGSGDEDWLLQLLAPRGRR